MQPTEQKAIEEYLARSLRDVSRLHATRLKPGLRILVTTNSETYESVCSKPVQNDLKDIQKLLSSPEILAPHSTETEAAKQETTQFIKQFILNHLYLLDDRTSILPNTYLVKKSIMEGERLKSVVHTSALKNVVTHAYFADHLEKKFKEAGASLEQNKDLVKRAIDSTYELHAAVAEGNISQILQCLSVPGVDVNFPDEQGMTPLHITAREGLSEMTKLLLTVPNIDVNVVNNNGWTPLHIAARQGFPDIVDALLTMPNIHTNAVNSDGWTALHWAAWHGFTDVVTVLLAAPSIEINPIDKTGCTPLHWAARNGHADIILVLLSLPSIEVNCIDNEKRTPLHLAAIYNHLKAVEALLSSPHIDTNLPDVDGATALHWAARNGYADILKVLLSHPDTRTYEEDNNGMVALDWAIRNGHTAIIQILSPNHKKYHRQKSSFWQMVKRFFKKADKNSIY